LLLVGVVLERQRWRIRPGIRALPSFLYGLILQIILNIEVKHAPRKYLTNISQQVFKK
jgi:hypothetical protein